VDVCPTPGLISPRIHAAAPRGARIGHQPD